MDKATLRTTYQQSEEAAFLNKVTQEGAARIHLRNAVGASVPLYAMSVLSSSSGLHLFILDDKEEAAYFFNDLEALSEKDYRPYFFPASYRDPYGKEKADPSDIQMRTETLEAVENSDARTSLAVVTYPEALAERVVTHEHLAKNSLTIETGKTYSVDFINELLIEFEFEKVDHVETPGQFAVRGGIVDIFSYADDHPFRVEFFGDEVDSIRRFDPVSQLSQKRVNRMTVVPNVREKLLREARCNALEFFGEHTVWVHSCDMFLEKVQQRHEKARELYEEKEAEEGVTRMSPDRLYVDRGEMEALIGERSIVEFGTSFYFEEGRELDLACKPQPSFNKDFDLLFSDLEEHRKAGYSLWVLAGQSDQVERLYRIIEDKGKEELGVQVFLLPLSAGFIDQKQGIVCYTDHQVFERHHRFKLKEGFKRKQEALTVQDLNELQPGDYVAHIDHGIGKYSGLETIDVNGKKQEAVRLIYRDEDILYVSIHSLHRIARYSGQEGKTPKIDKLGSNAWKNLKKRTKKKVKELAFDLIDLYAKRRASKGFAFAEDSYLQNELEASFIFEDTPDQAQATQDVKQDMEKSYPMDRLICGDVGFGKTEVAIRAAFKAVADNKQVAVLAPTTILTLQHYNSFKERLKDFPCSVGLLNRFRSSKEQKATREALANGQLDIVIGTHALVGKQVQFNDLGLLVIDEEQKFGVSTKEKLKTLREHVDTLTLTATPIPRTLQFSLMGARDLSIINTPPPNRHPVQTEVRPFDPEIAREAIQYEISRNGQVFFVHNRVQNIKQVKEMVEKLCPEVGVAIAHGQMEGKELEKVMMEFMEGKHEVLICTTIIMSGIDIPNCNTMIVNDAHTFGLSDLHQLRGRVGRTNKKAFCYMLAPALHSLTEEARKRLRAIEQFSDLGSGFNIAMRDLDIRGAGDLLGAEQSGFINEIGFEMYQKILNEAVQELKEKEFKDLYHQEQEESGRAVEECHIETDLEVRIPDEYVKDINERLSLYQRLDNVNSEEGLQRFEEELRDRFGPIPESVSALFDVVRLRWRGRDLGFEKLVIKNGKMLGTFVTDPDSPYYQSSTFSRVLEYLKMEPQKVEMKEKGEKLRLVFNEVDSVEQALNGLDSILQKELSES
ncbi:MAG: transcription-repair coupling factor [Flavobacteriales bacterium]